MPFRGLPELLRIAWPLIISTGSFSILHFCDRAFLSHYDTQAFRASLPGGILFFTLVCGFMALAGFSNTFVAQYWGRGERDGCAKAVAQGIFFGILSMPVIAALWPVGLLVLKLSGHEPEVLALESRYLSILMGASFGMVMSAALGSFFSGRGKTRVIMLCNVLANGINILLDYALVFGRWGFPEMGIAGAGWSTVIGSLVSPTIMAIMIFTGPLARAFNTRVFFRFDRVLFSRMLRYGAPSGIQLALDVAAFTLFVLILGRLDAVSHVASSIVLSINLIAFMPMIGMGTATSILVGQYLGRKQRDDAARVGWLALRVGLVYTLLVGATFVLFPDFYIEFFAHNSLSNVPREELFPLARNMLLMMMIWGVMDAAGIIMSGALRGAGDTHFVMWYQTLLAWGILVAGQLVIVLVLKQGIYACWSWALFYMTMLGLGFILRFRSGRWEKIDLLGPRVPAIEPIEHL